MDLNRPGNWLLITVSTSSYIIFFFLVVQVSYGLQYPDTLYERLSFLKSAHKIAKDYCLFICALNRFYKIEIPMVMLKVRLF